MYLIHRYKKDNRFTGSFCNYRGRTQGTPWETASQGVPCVSRSYAIACYYMSMRFRDYKIFRAGCYYHVYNRGNNKELVFLEPADYIQFLKRLKIVLGFSQAPLVSLHDTKNRTLRLSALPSGAFSILAYCLMPNHFHILIRQEGDVGVERLIGKVCTSYASYFNKKYHHVGHVFQDAFKAKLVDSDAYLTYLSAYIHNNPSNPLTHEYSSYFDYLGTRPGVLVDKRIILGHFQNLPEQYAKFVTAYNQEAEQNISHLLFEE